jgi:hypothetical protein
MLEVSKLSLKRCRCWLWFLNVVERWRVWNHIARRAMIYTGDKVDWLLWKRLFDLLILFISSCRSQWPRGLRHELSSLARALASWVRIPLKTWMSVCVYSVLFCVWVAALRQADPPYKESYRLCLGLINWKSGQGPTKDCRLIDR